MQDVVEQVTDILSDEKVIIFEEVLETYDNDKVSQFLVDEVPNLDELVQASSKKIAGMYKATTAQNMQTTQTGADFADQIQ